MKSSFTARCHVVENIALLLSQGRDGRQYPLSKVTTCATLGAEASFAPEHNGTESPVELSEGIAPPAGLQNRACHFSGTRLLKSVGFCHKYLSGEIALCGLRVSGRDSDGGPPPDCDRCDPGVAY